MNCHPERSVRPFAVRRVFCDGGRAVEGPAVRSRRNNLLCADVDCEGVA
jgi:hypothetical protein